MRINAHKGLGYGVAVLVLVLSCAVYGQMAGDADCSGDVNISDVVFTVQYIFHGGPAPDCRGIMWVTLEAPGVNGFPTIASDIEVRISTRPITEISWEEPSVAVDSAFYQNLVAGEQIRIGVTGVFPDSSYYVAWRYKTEPAGEFSMIYPTAVMQ